MFLHFLTFFSVHLKNPAPVGSIFRFDKKGVACVKVRAQGICFHLHFTSVNKKALGAATPRADFFYISGAKVLRHAPVGGGDGVVWCALPCFFAC